MFASVFPNSVGSEKRKSQTDTMSPHSQLPGSQCLQTNGGGRVLWNSNPPMLGIFTNEMGTKSPS